MPRYSTFFVVTDIAKVHEGFLRAMEAGIAADHSRRSRGLPPLNERVLVKLKLLQDSFNSQLRDLARLSSLQATQNIVLQIRKTAVRADTGISPHLRDRIVCRALPPISGFETGSVGIADEDLLNAGRTGLYWRAQEFGTGSDEVASITTEATGRVLRGYFYGTGFRGYPSPPDPGEFQNHAVFRPGPPSGGQKVPFGIGVVQREIQPRHFIRDGATEAGAKWKAQINAIQAATVAAVNGLA